MDPPEVLASPIKIVLRRLESLHRRRRGHPPTADRLNNGERLQRVRGIAQALVGPVQLLALLLGQLLGFAAYLHVSTPYAAVHLSLSHRNPARCIAVN